MQILSADDLVQPNSRMKCSAITSHMCIQMVCPTPSVHVLRYIFVMYRAYVAVPSAYVVVARWRNRYHVTLKLKN